MDIIKCFICHKEIAGYITGLKTHIKTEHLQNLQDWDSFQCSFCLISCSTYSNFIRHIRTQHPFHLHPEESVDDLHHPSPDTPFDVNISLEYDELLESSPDSPLPDRSLENILEGIAGDFILETRSKPNATGAEIGFSISMCDEILFAVVDGLRHQVLNYLNSKLSAADLLSKFEIKSPFEKFNTSAKQNKFINSQKTFVSPMEIVLGTREENILSNGTYIKKIVTESFQYVPIVKTLEVILNDPIKYNQILERSVNDDPDKLKSYFDSNLFKEHPLFNDFPDTIALQLYLDDVEICNPLGPNRKVHKICPFYFSILNFPPEVNSNLKSIHTVILPHVLDIENYGYEKIMKPLLDDLEKLESHEGVTIKVGDKLTTIHATVVNLSADTLAAHSIFGLLSPSARHFCRLCMISRTELHENGSNVVFEQRSFENYNQQLKNVQNEVNQTRLQTIKKETGIDKSCALHNLRYFHLTKNFGLDTMHDLLEGIVPFEIKNVLRYLIVTKNYFSVDLLNSKVNSFQYGYKDRKNRPKSNFTLLDLKQTKSHKMKSSSSQTLCLLRVLPFILEEFIKDDADKQHLEFIIDLIEICKIAGCTEINRGIIYYFKELIINHLEDFKKLFPNDNLINKHHHLTHYANSLVMFGPLQQSNCMRYEAKHLNFKKHAQICMNYKNICKTLIFREQVSQIKIVKDTKIIIKSKQKIITSDTIKYYKDEIIKSHFIKINGSDYLLQNIMCLKYEDSEPVFAKIVDITINKEIIWFSFQLFHTEYYSSNFAAYLVKLTPEVVTIKFDYLVYKSIFSLWKSKNNDKYVNIKSFYFF